MFFRLGFARVNAETCSETMTYSSETPGVLGEFYMQE